MKRAIRLWLHKNSVAAIITAALASAIGAPTNPTKIANTFATERGSSYTNKTISNHIDYLAEARVSFFQKHSGFLQKDCDCQWYGKTMEK